MRGPQRTVVLGEARAFEPHYRFARVLRATLARVFLRVFRVRVIDAHRIPKTGGAVLAGNHVSYADPILLWCSTPRPTHFMAKSELFTHPLIGWFLARVWAFPIRRGEADRSAISTAVAYLKGGDLVGIFPEGTRVREDREDLGDAHQGVAFIAMRAGAPVVPVGISGTDRIKPPGARMLRFPRVTICVGEPVDPEAFAHLDKRERLSAITAEVMARITSQLDRAKES